MENHTTLNKKLILGGALLGAFLVLVMPVFAYDKENTHPALTDQIVDFHNLSFPDKQITEEEKQWLIKGAIDEDTLERPLYHFYDPVYNRGIAGISSKDWATKDGVQAAYYNSQFTGFAAISGGDSANDFSYQRALRDYAKGDRKRALVAFGHILHLLEDAGVPDHTRNDAHPSFIHGQESPYEHEMAKWSPENFNIARSLFLRREKPTSLVSMEMYFDRIADYSNSNFFSKDTISNETYSKPNATELARLTINGWPRLFIVNKDKNGQIFPIALLDADSDKELKSVLISKKIGSYILDGYWERLSKEVVISGAGALDLFLEEAEKARSEYLAKAEQKKPSFWAQVVSLFGFGGNDEELATSDGRGTSDVDDDELSTSTTRRVVNPQGVTDDSDSGDTNGDRNVSPSLSPVLSPSPTVSPLVSPTVSPLPSPEATEGEASPELSTTEKININTADKELLMTLKGIKDAKAGAIIQHRQTYGQFQKIEDIMNVSGIGQVTFNNIKDQITVGDMTPTPTPVPVYGGGGSGGGGGGNQTPGPTPTPSPSPEPDGDTDGDTVNFGDVIINEVAWMGSDIGGTANQNANAEWVELYNTTGQTINLTNWTLVAQDETPSITASGSIGPLSYYLLERTSDDSVPGISADQIYTGALGNGGEHLVLKDVSGTIVDQVDGSNGWKLNGDDEVIGDNATKKTAQKLGNNWITAEPTPKAENQANPTAQAPSAVTNLAATHNSPIVTVTWTAPDPGAYSPASLSYDMRYSSTIFTEAASVSWWSGAAQVASSSLPSVGVKGASQSASFDVAYEYGQTLYFALKTKVINIPTCDVGNVDKCSGVSNLASTIWPSALDDAAWAMWGKDQYHTSLTSTTGPGITATISWTFDVAVEFGSDYAISQSVADGDGNIYFGAANGSFGKLIKLDKNGQEQWPEPYETNVSIGTPAVLSDGTVYFGRIGAGGVQWFTAVSSNSSNQWDYTGASTVKSVTVSSKGEPHFTYTSGTDKLAVLNTDGTLKTMISTSGVSGFAPVVLDDGTIITASNISGNQQFTAYSATGSQSWQVFSSPETYGNAPADPSYDKSTGKTYSAAGPKLFSIPSDGSTLNSIAIAPFNYTAATTVAISADTLYLGFNSPGAGSTTNEGGIFANNASTSAADWTNPDGAKIENNSYATVLLDGADSVSEHLKATGFNFNIPAGSSINGVKVEIRKSSAGEQIKDLSVKLVKGGNISGDDKADSNTWPSGVGTYIVHGEESDLWGSSLTPSDINAGDFGVAIAAILPVTGQHIGGIDNIKITVYYTEPSLLYALNKSDLSAKWSAPFQADGQLNKQLVIDSGGNTYFSTQDGKLYRVNATGAGVVLVNSGSNSAISPVLTAHGLVWGYGSKVVLVE